MDGYPTTARANSTFTATCGHEVLAECDYIVKRPGRFHCSPACAEADTTAEITILLQDEGSLSELLYGVWGALFWATDNGDGTYSLHGAGTATGLLGEAFLRVVLEEALKDADDDLLERLPPAYTQDPELDVEEFMEKLRVRLGWGTALDGQEMD